MKRWWTGNLNTALKKKDKVKIAKELLKDVKLAITGVSLKHDNDDISGKCKRGPSGT